jgi:biotin transport system permease protein
VLAFRSLNFEGRAIFPPTFSPPGFFAGLSFALTVIESFAAGALLFRVTTMTELRESLGRLETFLLRPLTRLLGRPLQPRLSLGIALMLGFLPRFFELWETLSSAYDARSGKGGLPRILALVPLVTERMMESAAETAGALESRGLYLVNRD